MTAAIAFAFAPLPKVVFLSLFIQPLTEEGLYSPSLNGFIQSNHDFLFFLGFFKKKCLYLFMDCIFQSREKRDAYCVFSKMKPKMIQISAAMLHFCLFFFLYFFLFFFFIPGLMVCKMPIIVHFFSGVTCIITCKFTQ